MPEPQSNALQEALHSGRFVITAEMAPPDSADADDVLEAVAPYGHLVDAINVTDSSGAHCHMGSMACSLILLKAGYEPVMQISCRDRNRIAMQGEVLGAAALGIRNILCLTGDGVECGDHKEAKPVFDLDSMTLLSTIRHMRDQQTFLSGRAIKGPLNVHIGAAANPFAPPLDFRPVRLQKKIEAGAQFIQTQYCFDVERLEAYMAAVRDMGLHRKIPILVGVGPMASAKGAQWMRTNVPGVHIPDHIIKRMEDADDPKVEGRIICAEIISRIRDIEGVRGIHMMAFRQEKHIPEILDRAGITPDIAAA